MINAYYLYGIMMSIYQKYLVISALHHSPDDGDGRRVAGDACDNALLRGVGDVGGERREAMLQIAKGVTHHSSHLGGLFEGLHDDRNHLMKQSIR
jgi:hypothetical protein